MIKTLEDPFYYLKNFEKVLEWIMERYNDLLIGEEREFIERFSTLPQASRALLVRMIMRKGDLFRAAKLNYDEIGCTREAARPLTDMGWVDDTPLLTLEQLFGLLTKTEISSAFSLSPQMRAARKADQLEALRAEFIEGRHFRAWCPASDECIFQIRITSLCDRLRLMFFGNFHQDWLEFVLSDLGIFRYEKVEFSPSSRGFRTRQDVDEYLHLHECRERFRQGEPVDSILDDVRAGMSENHWLESRRMKLLFQIGQHHEQMKEFPSALRIYSECSFPGARIRSIRVLEQCGQFDSAFELAKRAEREPESEAEKQQLSRMMPRLHRKLGKARLPAYQATPAPVIRIDLELPRPQTPYSVEMLVRDHLAQASAPVYYVENTLINSLFGLLCWSAVFTAVPGAFFHPFHRGPADLLSADFHRRRQREFDGCLTQLESGQYKQTIVQNFKDKAGIQSPFVVWEILTEVLLNVALACLPVEHLRKWFGRILTDIQINRSGFPDLIQFWPQEQRYQMIEVKGPGDRLQDNQIRWLDYFMAHDMPVAVCYVQWMESAE